MIEADLHALEQREPNQSEDARGEGDGQRAQLESFNGKLRDECLNANWFDTLDDARGLIES